MYFGVHLGELKQVFPVVARTGVVIRGRRKSEVGLTPELFCGEVGSMQRAGAARRDAGWENNDGAIQAHLNLKIALGPAVIGARSR